jgi:hypothetical protein
MTKHNPNECDTCYAENEFEVAERHERWTFITVTVAILMCAILSYNLNATIPSIVSAPTISGLTLTGPFTGGSPSYHVYWYEGTSSNCNGDSPVNYQLLLIGPTYYTATISGYYCYSVMDSATTPVEIMSHTLYVNTTPSPTPLSHPSWYVNSGGGLPCPVCQYKEDIAFGLNVTYIKFWNPYIQRIQIWYPNNTIVTTSQAL